MSVNIAGNMTDALLQQMVRFIIVLPIKTIISGTAIVNLNGARNSWVRRTRAPQRVRRT